LDSAAHASGSVINSTIERKFAMMETENIIRAWKDEDFLLSLSNDEQHALPANPAGRVELSQKDLVETAEGRTFFTSIGFICIFPPYC
jgi:mersacidin/lichenicidin family type 2 lantibiotic